MKHGFVASAILLMLLAGLLLLYTARLEARQMQYAVTAPLLALESTSFERTILEQNIDALLYDITYQEALYQEPLTLRQRISSRLFAALQNLQVSGMPVQWYRITPNPHTPRLTAQTPRTPLLPADLSRLMVVWHEQTPLFQTVHVVFTGGLLQNQAVAGIWHNGFSDSYVLIPIQYHQTVSVP